MQRPRLSTCVVVVALLLGPSVLVPRAESARTLGAPSAAGDLYRYGASWNGIPVASAQLLIAPDAGTLQPAVRLHGSARTSAFLDLFWRMRDRFDAVVPIDPPAPGTFYLAQDENSRRRETFIARDTDSDRLVGRMERPGKKTRHGAAELRRGLHDPASVAYLIRTLPADVRTPQTYDVFEGWKVYRLRVTPVGEDELDALGRTWRARKLHLGLTLVPRDDLPAKKRKPPKVQRADLWISDDDDRVLLRMEAGTWWGRVTIALTGRGPADSPS
jgi:hypothetical protein